METPSPTPPVDNRFEIPLARWAMWLSAFVVFLVVMTGHVRYTEGDSRYSLLASQALLEHGSLRLDPYARELDLVKLNNGHAWMIFYSGDQGHLYYDYPIGTPIFSMPFVWVARQLGMKPVQREDDTALQIAIAAILCASIFLLLFRLSNLYLGDWAALLFSLAIFFGSSLISTLGTALWSQNFLTFFTLLALLELVEWERGKRPQLRGAWLGFLLFAAYLCRPTAAALILVVFGYLLWRNRKALPYVMGVSGGFFLLFLLWSRLEMGMLLPRYYDPTLWQAGNGFWEHWLPLWFGPARGLWAFTPVMLLIFGAWGMRKLRFHPLVLLFWAWIVLHTILLARSQSPWGGWSYGPRFFTEVVPGMALVLLMMAENVAAMQARWRNAILAFFIVASVVGFYAHTLQGLENIETMAWNDNPNIDQHWPERRWDWGHPQFLATSHQRMELIAERDWQLQAGQALRHIPDGAAMLLGDPDPLARDCFERWNRTNRFGHRQKLYNSLHALEADGIHEFYFLRELLDTVRDLPKVIIDSATAQQPRLGEFLANNIQYEIIIAAKDECTSGLALETRSYLYTLGSQIDSVRLRQSYLLHLKGGKIIHEAWGDQHLDYTLPGRPFVRAGSSGLFVGNAASILVEGQECCLNLRGMNVVVLDKNRNIITTTNFDTHADDRERMTLMKAKY